MLRQCKVRARDRARDRIEGCTNVRFRVRIEGCTNVRVRVEG